MANETPRAPPPPAYVSPETVEKAVEALLKWKSKKSETQKPQLLEDDEFIYLILTLKKIQHKGTSRVNPYKIPVPHPLIDPVNDQNELCLIVDDRPHSGLTKEEVKKKVSNDNLSISKIIRVSKLRSNYKAFEAKRKLCGSYDMFLADRRIVHLLPKLLGKEFFRKRKIPVTLNLMHKNWKEQIERACSSALVFLRSGTCCVVKVGRMSMEKDGIVENVVAVVNGVAEIVPKKWSGIRSLHLKLSESLALPIYQAMPGFKLKIESGREVTEDEGERKGAEEESVKEEKKKVGKKKGRIQEVRYMDANEFVGDSNGEGNNDDNEENEEEEGREVDDTKMVIYGLEVKQRKKRRDKGEEEKNEKAAAKVRRKEGVKAKIEGGLKPKKQKKDQLGLEDVITKVEDGSKKKKKLSAK